MMSKIIQFLVQSELPKKSKLRKESDENSIAETESESTSEDSTVVGIETLEKLKRDLREVS